MSVYVLAVVILAYLGRGEDGVGLGDLYEAVGSFRIIGVAVGVVCFGEGIEGSFGGRTS